MPSLKDMIHLRRKPPLRLRGGELAHLDEIREFVFDPCADNIVQILRKNFQLNSFQNLQFPAKMYQNLKSKIDSFLFNDSEYTTSTLMHRRLQGIHILMYMAKNLRYELQKDPTWVARTAECAAGLFVSNAGDLEVEIVCADALHELLQILAAAPGQTDPQRPPVLIPWEPLLRSMLALHAPGFLPEDQARRLFAGPELAAYHLHALARLVRAARRFFRPTADQEILDLLRPVGGARPGIPTLRRPARHPDQTEMNWLHHSRTPGHQNRRHHSNHRHHSNY